MPNSFSSLSLDQLQQAVALKEQIAALESQLAAVLGGTVFPTTTPTRQPGSAR